MDESGGIKFALLVPCYNAEKYIEGFLKNISLLTTPFDEVLFYDDGSTDNTFQLLTSKGCKVIKGDKNRGQSYARNMLAKATEAEWIHFHDVDDELDPEYLVKTANVAEKDSVDVVLCNVNWYDADSKNLILQWNYSSKFINENPVAYTIANPIGGINGLYRKSKFAQTGGFNAAIRIWEDADLHVKLAAVNSRFYVVEEVLSYSFRYPESTSVDQRAGWLTRLQLLNEYFHLFSDNRNRREIGSQAQIVASRLIMSGLYKEAKAAYQLSELCNVQVPDNNSKLWAVLKGVIPKTARIELRLLQLKWAFNRTPNKANAN